MPPLVADPIPWHLSAATVCVGPGEQPGRLEWELRSGAASLAIDFEGPLHYHSAYPRPTDEGDRTGSLCHPCFLRSKISRRKAPRPPLAAGSIASERLPILEHPPQRQVRLKTGAPTRLGAAVFRFEWIVAGLTDVRFWIALVVPPWAGILALEGPVRFRLALGSTLARLNPNRCLAGGPTSTAVRRCGPAVLPSCSTVN
jgi:hypothetical protein